MQTTAARWCWMPACHTIKFARAGRVVQFYSTRVTTYLLHSYGLVSIGVIRNDSDGVRHSVRSALAGVGKSALVHLLTQGDNQQSPQPTASLHIA